MKPFSIPLTFAMLAISMVLTVDADESNDVLDAMFQIDNQTIKLINGRAEQEAAPGSAAKIVTQTVDEPAFGDLDGDGQADAALFLCRQTGGSGTFYYVAAARSIDGRWQGTNAVFIGDRVIPATLDINNGVIVARYLDRPPEASMAEPPSIVKTIEIALVGGHLEVLRP